MIMGLGYHVRYDDFLSPFSIYSNFNDRWTSVWINSSDWRFPGNFMSTRSLIDLICAVQEAWSFTENDASCVNSWQLFISRQIWNTTKNLNYFGTNFVLQPEGSGRWKHLSTFQSQTLLWKEELTLSDFSNVRTQQNTVWYNRMPFVLTEMHKLFHAQHWLSFSLGQ